MLLFMSLMIVLLLAGIGMALVVIAYEIRQLRRVFLESEVRMLERRIEDRKEAS